MKFRLPFICALGLSAWSVGLPSYARTINVDMYMTCSSYLASNGTLSINLAGTGKNGNSADSGVNFPILVCTDSLEPDSALTALSFDPSASYLYTWVDLSAAGVAISTLTGPATNPATPELSSFQSQNVSIVAMVEVLKLTGSYSGDYEIIFNYQSFPENACQNVFQGIEPSFTWFGKTYVFTGAGGVGSPCESASETTNTNDFLFGPNGKLLGYNSAADASTGAGFSLTKGLPPGWATKK
jgi:hypothetical protein